MADPFEILFLYGKGTIKNRLNKLNCIPERSVSNSGITETYLKSGGLSDVVPHKVQKKTVNHVDM